MTVRRARLLAAFAILSVFALATGASSSANVPRPGTHGVAKRWPGVVADVTNFSPFAFNAHIVAITPDRKGGVWFGLGQTLEHIDRSGVMRNATVSPEYLWQIRDLAYDPAGRLWFSLGQSGRIGTFDRNGHLNTRVLVPRKFFPDIRSIAFDHAGTLWFGDVGRKSIGRQASNGDTKEIPVGTVTNLELCGGKIWLSDVQPRSESIVSVVGDLDALHAARTWQSGGLPSIACGSSGTLSYAHASRFDADVEGTIDAHEVIHEQAQSILHERVYAGVDGSLWYAGESADEPSDVELATGEGARRRSWRLEIPWAVFDQAFAVTEDGSAWVSVIYPHSIVRIAFGRLRTNN